MRKTELQFKSKVDLQASTQLIQRRFREYVAVCSASLTSSPHISPHHWTPPPPGWIEVNIGAALSSSKTALAVVARDHGGFICNVWAKVIPLRSPLQAETEALLWAVQIPKRERWNLVAFEGDSEVCFNSLSDSAATPDWSIQTTISNIHSLAEVFHHSSFVWIKRSCNATTHEAARLALNSRFSFVFNKGNLPPALAVVCKEDYLRYSSLV